MIVADSIHPKLLIFLLNFYSFSLSLSLVKFIVIFHYYLLLAANPFYLQTVLKVFQVKHSVKELNLPNPHLLLVLDQNLKPFFPTKLQGCFIQVYDCSKILQRLQFFVLVIFVFLNHPELIL